LWRQWAVEFGHRQLKYFEAYEMSTVPINRLVVLSALVAGVVLGAAVTLYAIKLREAPLTAQILYQVANAPRSVDFSKIHDGRWRLFCLVGAYESPRNTIAAYAKAEGIDLAQIAGLNDLPGSTLSEGTAFAIVVDTTNRLQWVPLSSRVVVAQSGSSICTSRKSPVIEIPVSGSLPTRS
jgi:hypothetical protein